MVRLKNIKREGNIISADYYPESTNERGFVAVDINTLEMVECIETSEDEVLGWYYHFTKVALIEMCNDEKPPKERTVMWY